MSIKTTPGARRTRELDGFPAVRGLADDPDAWLASQDDTEARANQPLVVGDDHGDDAA